MIGSWNTVSRHRLWSKDFFVKDLESSHMISVFLSTPKYKTRQIPKTPVRGFLIDSTSGLFPAPSAFNATYIIFFLMNAGMSKSSSSDVFAATVMGTGCAARGAFVGA